MIKITTRIVCDSCGYTVDTCENMKYRISGSTERTIRILESNGWVFVRGKNKELVTVQCDDCAGKPYLVVSDDK